MCYFRCVCRESKTRYVIDCIGMSLFILVHVYSMLQVKVYMYMCHTNDACSIHW